MASTCVAVVTMRLCSSWWCLLRGSTATVIACTVTLPTARETRRAIEKPTPHTQQQRQAPRQSLTAAPSTAAAATPTATTLLQRLLALPHRLLPLLRRLLPLPLLEDCYTTPSVVPSASWKSLRVRRVMGALAFSREISAADLEDDSTLARCSSSVGSCRTARGVKQGGTAHATRHASEVHATEKQPATSPPSTHTTSAHGGKRRTHAHTRSQANGLVGHDVMLRRQQDTVLYAPTRADVCREVFKTRTLMAPPVVCPAQPCTRTD